jgi:hypothetical protein
MPRPTARAAFESEISAVPVDDLTLRLSASLDDATYLSYQNAPCPAEALAPTNAAQGAIICNLSGKPLVGAPKWIVNPGMPAPAGGFKLILRTYQPKKAVLDGSYHLPPLATSIY